MYPAKNPNNTAPARNAANPKEEPQARNNGAPSLSLPKGGGALRGIDEKFRVNAANGTSAFSIPLPFTAGRGGLTPSVGMSYNSGAGNSILGIGWTLNIPSIRRKTDKQLPTYRDEDDVFTLSGAEDLVPALLWRNNQWEADEHTDGQYHVQRYRPRIEGDFARIEKITHPALGAFWRVTSRTNVTTFYGYHAEARIANPDTPDHIFEWLPEVSFDNKGNCIVYSYKHETLDNVPNALHEHHRHNGTARCTNAYIKRVRYGNRTPYYPNPAQPYVLQPVAGEFLFETAFDFGEHHADIPLPDETPGMVWESRADAFSSYRSGFDIRTYRLLRRVLMFHHFDELADGEPCLVRSMDCTYDSSSTALPQDAEVLYLSQITQHGYIRKPDGTYSRKSLPPMEFAYERLQWNTEVHEVEKASIANLPIGLGQNYQWTDFYGEGIPGVMSEQGEGWFYKANLGDVDEDGAVRFGTMNKVASRPSFTGISTGQLQIQDIEANGKKQVVLHANGIHGFFEQTANGEWLPFQPFGNALSIDMRDPNVRLIDLDGNGMADILISEERVFTWHTTKGKEGYSAAQRTPKALREEQGPAIVFADAQQTIFLADMSGDGLTDIVRIRNGEICYWPNLGYGHFGAQVAMDNAPVFDHPDHFNPAYLHLADISGTGATDILYLGHNTCRAYLNLSGNAWSAAQKIQPFFPTEQPNALAVVDLLGNGTSCIVWSSALPHNATAPMRYIDLMGGKKPHLLVQYINNFGKETTLHYKSSTWFYLRDKLANKPWITKLPFPVHCVRHMEVRDRITGVRFASEYSFHHGYYDHAEREFRGFGMVEQLDTEHYEHWVQSNASNIVEADLHQAPILTKTWFHTGAFLDSATILSHFSSEYWYEEMQRQGFPVAATEHALDDARVIAAPGLPADVLDHLSPDEWREALRSCKGMALRTEVFALDAPTVGATPEQQQQQLTPYSVGTHNCVVELLQVRSSNRHAVFVTKESEALTYHYERNIADPRIAHALNIAFDDVGNVLESASVVYGRKADDGALPVETRTKQRAQHITYAKHAFTNDIHTTADYYLRAASETQTFELKGMTTAQPLYSIADFENILATSAEIPYHDITAVPPAGTVVRRLIEHERTVYYHGNMQVQLPLHNLAAHGIVFESYKLAYTPALLNDIFGAKATDALMLEGKFMHSEGDNKWWIRSGTAQYTGVGETLADVQARFFAPLSYTDPYGAVTRVRYFSTYFLLVQETEDAKNNRSRVETFNLRTLSPQRLIDINDNISEVLIDELGLVKASAVFGKGSEADDVSGFTDYTTAAEQTTIDDFLTATTSTQLRVLGRDLLRHASTRFVYDLHRYRNTGGSSPTVAATIVREQHHQANNNTPLQLSFEYTDGMGNIAMKKIQAEPGVAKRATVNPDNTYSVADVDTSALIPPQLRWLGNGRTVLNNKGNAVKQYEPYFSTTHQFENQTELVETGVTPILFYDAMGRLARAEAPDGTLSRTEFSAWSHTQYDPNDTVLESTWYTRRFYRLMDAELLAAGKDPAREQEAATQTAQHANTPSVQHFDTLGRSILSVEHNGKDAFNNDVLLYTHTDMDIEGNTRSVTDARGNVIVHYKYDMLGSKVYQESADAGKRWMLHNILGNPLRTWDERNHEFAFEYDILHRPTLKRVRGGDGTTPLDNVVERVVYGEGVPNDKALNARAKAIAVYDTAGKVESLRFDFKGNLLHSRRTFARSYKTAVDWSGAALDAKLEAESFETTVAFDALNRMVQQTTTEGSIYQPEYNEANLLDKVRVTQNGATELFVKNIDYNEKGQRKSITYGNDITTQYSYDKETFRLLRLTTTKSDNTPVQDMRYTFDPIGNITHAEDTNVPTVFFNNQKTTGLATYRYDALYRLAEATGREHVAQVAFGIQDNYNDTPFLKQYSQNDPMAWRNYTQQYRYDEVGNIVQMRHTANNGNWTRDYAYAAMNNRLLSTTVGAETYDYTYHPQHGFIASMPHLQSMHWNFRDQLQAVARQAVVAGTPETTYYVYDGNGQRARTITERQAPQNAAPSQKWQRLYLGSLEIYREYDTTNATTLQRNTLHIVDDKKRIAMIETRTQGNDGSPQRLVRYQFANHLGSACVETDATGRVISYEEFHPFGTTSYQAVDKDIKAAAKRYRYTSMERDEESGFTYHSARYYIPWLGRWCNPDPIGLKGGINLYAYSSGNPMRFVDPSGNGPEDTTATIEDIFNFIRNQAGFETGAERGISWSSKSASPFGTAAHAKATGVLDSLKQMGVKGAERIYSEVRTVGGTVTQIGGTPGGPKGSFNLDLVAVKEGQSLSVGQKLDASVGELISDIKYGGGTIAKKYDALGISTTTTNGRTAASTTQEVSAIVNASKSESAVAQVVQKAEAAVQAVTDVAKVETAVATTAKTSSLVSKVAPVVAKAAPIVAKAAPIVAKAAPVVKALAPVARFAGKVAGPLGIGIGVAQIATAKTTEEKIDGGVTATSSALMMSKHPVAIAAGAGLMAGQVIEKTLDVSDYSSSIGLKADEAVGKLGAGETTRLIVGATATVLSTPSAIGIAAADKITGGRFARWIGLK